VAFYICDRIGIRVPVDLSILVAWRIVAFAVVGGPLACQNFEISSLFVHLPYPVSTKYFHTVGRNIPPIVVCVCKMPK
jgi:hypothetical protein